jgi:hypothetical protein
VSTDQHAALTNAIAAQTHAARGTRRSAATARANSPAPTLDADRAACCRRSPAFDLRRGGGMGREVLGDRGGGLLAAAPGRPLWARLLIGQLLALARFGPSPQLPEREPAGGGDGGEHQRHYQEDDPAAARRVAEAHVVGDRGQR